MQWIGATPRRWLGRALALLLLVGLVAVTWYLMPQLPRATIAAGEYAGLERFSSTGDLLVTTQQGNARMQPSRRLCVWDVRTGQLRFACSDVWEACFSPDERLLAATGKHYHRRIWDLATGEEKADLALDSSYDSYYYASEFSPDGRCLVLGHSPGHGEEPRLRFWDIESKQFAGDIIGTHYPRTFVGDENAFATLHSPAGSVTIWHWGANQGMPAKVLERSFCSRLSVISPGLELAATLDQHNKEGNTLDLTVWDVASGSPIGTVWHVDATTEAFPLVWFSNDARFLFLRFYERGEKGPTPRLRAWDIADGLAELCTLDHGYSIHVSPDGKWIGRTTADGVDLFDTTGAVRGALRRPGDYSAGWDGSRSPFSRLHYAGATYSPDSRYLLVTGLSRQGKDLLSSGWLPGWVRRASAEGAVARLWRLDDAEEVAAFTRFRQAEFSPDGKTLATLHNDNRIRIWDVPPRKPLVLPLVVSAVMWLAILLAVRFGRAWLARRRITGLAQQTTAASHG